METNNRSARAVDGYVGDIAGGRRRPAAPNSDRFAIATRVEDGVAILAVQGELDMSSFAGATEAGTAALDTAPRVAVDLSGVTFMDSTGVSWLMGLRRLLAARDERLRVVGASDEVRRVLETLSLWETMTA